MILKPVSAFDVVKKAYTGVAEVDNAMRSSSPAPQAGAPATTAPTGAQPNQDMAQRKQIAENINTFLGHITKLRQTMNPQIQALNRILKGGYEKQLRTMAQQLGVPNAKFPIDVNVVGQTIQQANQILGPFLTMEVQDTQQITNLNTLIDKVLTGLGGQKASSPSQPAASPYAMPPAAPQPASAQTAAPTQTAAPNAAAPAPQPAGAQPSGQQAPGRPFAEQIGRAVGAPGRMLQRGKDWLKNRGQEFSQGFKSKNLQSNSDSRIITAYHGSAEWFSQ